LFFSRVYLSSLKERAFRVSFDVCFSPEREREREKRGTFSRLANWLFCDFPGILTAGIWNACERWRSNAERNREREREREEKLGHFSA
jgi:hypothetical protein